MSTTLFVGTPLAAEFPASNFPQLLLSNRRPALAYDAATKETAYWTFQVPQGFTGTPSAVLTLAMASATSGNTIWDVAIEAITSGDATDTDATTSFDADNVSSSVAAPATAGYITQTTITLTNNDSMAVSDYIRVSVARDAANGSDTATGDAYLLSVELRY